MGARYSNELQGLDYIDGLVLERRNSIANALELRLSCTSPSAWECTTIVVPAKVAWQHVPLERLTKNTANVYRLISRKAFAAKKLSSLLYIFFHFTFNHSMQKLYYHIQSVCLIEDQYWIDCIDITSRWDTFVLFHLYGNKGVSLPLWPIRQRWFHTFSPCAEPLGDGHEGMWARFGSQGSIALNWHSRYSGTWLCQGVSARKT